MTEHPIDTEALRARLAPLAWHSTPPITTDHARRVLDALDAAEHRAARAEAEVSEQKALRMKAVAAVTEAEAERDEWRQTALDERAAALDALEQIGVRDARIKAVRELHQQSALIRYVPRSMRQGHDDDQPFHYCTGCDGARYPCDTIRALDGDA